MAAKIKPPKVKRKRLTLISLNVAPFGAFRNPTSAITKKGGLITKTRKPL